MLNLCEKIKNNLKCLPKKDVRLCEEYFAKRDFQSILDIAKSALIMKEMDDLKAVHSEKWSSINIGDLQELVLDTQEYLSYLDVSEFNNEDDDIYYE